LPIIERRGDLLRDDAEALINTVNCVGVMGKGLALSFKQTYPAMFRAYQFNCFRHQVHPGRMDVHELSATERWSPAPGQPRLIVNFPTKLHWRNPSQLGWVHSGLHDLAKLCRDQQLSSIALPPLGCGLGGLDWPTVHTLIKNVLVPAVPDTEVRLYLP